MPGDTDAVGIDRAAERIAGGGRSRENRIDVCITDIRMVGMSGVELLEQIKGVDAGIEVIMLTAYETVDTLRLACMPLLNFLGPVAAGLLTGSFVTETIFFLPGLGQHYVSAAVNKSLLIELP